MIEKQKKVKIEYEGKLDSGEVFDSSEKHGQALEFTIGEKQVIPGFEDAIKDMKPGEEKEIKIASDQAYGQRREELTKKIPRDQLPKDQEPKPGMILGLGTPDGKQIPARIIEVTDKEITIDLNHPLAGQNLNFKIKLIEVN